MFTEIKCDVELCLTLDSTTQVWAIKDTVNNEVWWSGIFKPSNDSPLGNPIIMMTVQPPKMIKDVVTAALEEHLTPTVSAVVSEVKEDWIPAEMLDVNVDVEGVTGLIEGSIVCRKLEGSTWTTADPDYWSMSADLLGLPEPLKFIVKEAACKAASEYAGSNENKEDK